MGEVIRDEDFNRRVRHAQEFLDPGRWEAIGDESRLTSLRRRCYEAKLPARHSGDAEPRTAETHSTSLCYDHNQ
jgi:hypothetical protein